MRLPSFIFLLIAGSVFASSFLLSGSALAANTAVLSITPASGTYNTGDMITADIKLNTAGQAACGVNLYLAYSGLTFDSFDWTGSAFDDPLSQPASGDPSPLHFARLSQSSSGATGASLQFVKVKFIMGSAGNASLSFSSTPEIPNCDSSPSSIYGSSSGASFTSSSGSITQITPTTSPTTTTTPTPLFSNEATPTPQASDLPETGGSSGQWAFLCLAAGGIFLLTRRLYTSLK